MMVKPIYDGDGSDLRDVDIPDEWNEIIDRMLRADSEGGTVDCICEGCGKWMKGYPEPLPYGTVRIGRPHWFCSECVAKWNKEDK